MIKRILERILILSAAMFVLMGVYSVNVALQVRGHYCDPHVKVTSPGYRCL
jgi:hypothetical protein